MIHANPTKAQLSAPTRNVVCRSFAGITYSAKLDTSETISQVRRHNAAYGSFKCQPK